MKLVNRILLGVVAIFTLISCGESKKPPYNLNIQDKNVLEIPYEKIGGIKVIPVKLNGVTMNMIYDTGCSGMLISLLEVRTLAKNGKLEDTDVLESEYSTIADGSIVKNGAINIKEIEIGGEDGIILKNIRATVVMNQEAPLLLGNGVMDNFASVEMDNVSETIKFHKK